MANPWPLLKRRRHKPGAGEFDGTEGLHSGGEPTTPSEEHRQEMREGRKTQDGPRKED